MQYRYKYTGENDVVIQGVGIVKVGDVINTEIEINHPLFEKDGTPKEDKKHK